MVSELHGWFCPCSYKDQGDLDSYGEIPLASVTFSCYGPTHFQRGRGVSLGHTQLESPVPNHFHSKGRSHAQLMECHELGMWSQWHITAPFDSSRLGSASPPLPPPTLCNQHNRKEGWAFHAAHTPSMALPPFFSCPQMDKQVGKAFRFDAMC